MRRNRRCVWTSIAWFNLKSRSLLLVYVGAISDSYTDYFLSRCLAKTTTELATTSMCKHKPKALFSGFADLQAFCGMFAGRFGRLFCFWQILCKSALNRKIIGGVAESDLHTQLQCTTLASKIATYMRGRGAENMMTHSKLSNFHGF